MVSLVLGLDAVSWGDDHVIVELTVTRGGFYASLGSDSGSDQCLDAIVPDQATSRLRAQRHSAHG